MVFILLPLQEFDIFAKQNLGGGEGPAELVRALLKDSVMLLSTFGELQAI